MKRPLRVTTLRDAFARRTLVSEREAMRQRILATVDSIPRGKVATYGQIAREAGLAGRARLVGRVLRDLPAGSKLAWHRVVNAAGKISVRGTSEREQARRLKREGVSVQTPGRVDLERHRWRG
jgi:methylated-DNA-protein-cysteine methyltransferase-like protein